MGPSPTLVYPCGFFDGVAADSKGGACFYLALNESHSFEFAMGGSLCTNTKAELLAPWDLLTVTKVMGIPLLNIYGDSTFIINWENYQASLDSPCLSDWCMDTRCLKYCFSNLSIKHTYQEHNQRAYSLSKEALALAPGCGSFLEIYDGFSVMNDTFKLF